MKLDHRRMLKHPASARPLKGASAPALKLEALTSGDHWPMWEDRT
jgi:hypothetical protein